jgi:hypothetical protein
MTPDQMIPEFDSLSVILPLLFDSVSYFEHQYHFIAKRYLGSAVYFRKPILQSTITEELFWFCLFVFLAFKL